MQSVFLFATTLYQDTALDLSCLVSALADDDVGEAAASASVSEIEDEVIEGSDGLPPVILEGGLRIPGSVYGQLFDYQKVGVQWLWELHCQRAGGIIGDEMGLGKTVQVLSFLGALHDSGMYKPSIVICPVTLLQQWKREASKWYPKFKVEILHDSANSSSKRARDTVILRARLLGIVIRKRLRMQSLQKSGMI
jgi:DNA excision repair protein ERCC-6